jgi:hypothetical protein
MCAVELMHSQLTISICYCTNHTGMLRVCDCCYSIVHVIMAVIVAVSAALTLRSNRQAAVQ